MVYWEGFLTWVGVGSGFNGVWSITVARFCQLDSACDANAAESKLPLSKSRSDSEIGVIAAIVMLLFQERSPGALLYWSRGMSIVLPSEGTKWYRPNYSTTNL